MHTVKHAFIYSNSKFGSSFSKSGNCFTDICIHGGYSVVSGTVSLAWLVCSAERFLRDFPLLNEERHEKNNDLKNLLRVFQIVSSIPVSNAHSERVFSWVENTWSK